MGMLTNFIVGMLTNNCGYHFARQSDYITHLKRYNLNSNYFACFTIYTDFIFEQENK